MKKDGSYGTSVSINSSFSTAQNIGGVSGSNCENKFKPKRGVLTVQKDRPGLFNKFSQKSISIGAKQSIKKRKCDSERGKGMEKELFMADQPRRQKYETQRIIENIQYDNSYSQKPRRSNKKASGPPRESKKTQICLENSFESDREAGFKGGQPQEGTPLVVKNDITFSFNNLSETKFSATKQPVSKKKRPSRLVSENKRKSKNVFLDDEDEQVFLYDPKATGKRGTPGLDSGFKKGTGFY